MTSSEYSAHDVIGFICGAIAVALFWFVSSRANRLLLHYLKEREIFLTLTLAKHERQRRMQYHAQEHNNPYTPQNSNHQISTLGSEKRSLLSALTDRVFRLNAQQQTTTTTSNHEQQNLHETQLGDSSNASGSITQQQHQHLVWYSDCRLMFYSLSIISAVTYAMATLVLLMSPSNSPLRHGNLESDVLTLFNVCAYLSMVSTVIWTILHGIMLEWRRDHIMNPQPQQHQQNNNINKITGGQNRKSQQQQFIISSTSNLENNSKNKPPGSARSMSDVAKINDTNNNKQTRRSGSITNANAAAVRRQQQQESHPTMSGDIGNDTEDYNYTTYDDNNYYNDDDDAFLPSYRESRAEGGDDDDDNDEEEYSKYFQGYGSTDDISNAATIAQQQQQQQQQFQSPPPSNTPNNNANGFLQSTTPIISTGGADPSTTRTSSYSQYSNGNNNNRHQQQQQQQNQKNQNTATKSSTSTTVPWTCDNCTWRLLEILYPYRLIISVIATILFYIAITVMTKLDLINGEDFSAALSGFLGIICGVLSIGGTLYLCDHGARNAARRFGLALAVLCVCLMGRCAMVASPIQQDVDNDLTILALPLIDSFSLACVIVVLPSRKFCLCFESQVE